jgi:hypothetical protein
MAIRSMPCLSRTERVISAWSVIAISGLGSAIGIVTSGRSPVMTAWHSVG